MPSGRFVLPRYFGWGGEGGNAANRNHCCLECHQTRGRDGAPAAFSWWYTVILAWDTRHHSASFRYILDRAPPFASASVGGVPLVVYGWKLLQCKIVFKWELLCALITTTLPPPPSTIHWLDCLSCCSISYPGNQINSSVTCPRHSRIRRMDGV